MKTEQVHRNPRKEYSYPELDLTVPINVNELMTKSGDCFGVELDITDERCVRCADNEVCSIMFGYNLRLKVKERESIEKFLDTSDWTLVNEDRVQMWLELKPRTTEQLLDKVLDMANSPDDEAGVYWMKKFMKDRGWKSKEGKLYAE